MNNQFEWQDKAQRRLNLATHEAGHFVAGMHCGVPTNDQGMFVKDGEYCTDDGGFCGLDLSSWNLTLELTDPHALDYAVISLCGPFAQQGVLPWDVTKGGEISLADDGVSDFVRAMGCRELVEGTHAGCLSQEAFLGYKELARICILSDDPAQELAECINATPTPEGKERLARLLKAIPVARKLCSVYPSTIAAIGNVLAQKGALSKQECDEWAASFTPNSLDL